MSEIKKIQEDKYGNVIEKIENYYENYHKYKYEYNDQDDLIQETCINKDGHITWLVTYEYQYNENHHKTECKRTSKAIHEGKISYEAVEYVYYMNRYNEQNQIIEITYFNDQKDVFQKDSFYYESNLLMMKECDRLPDDSFHKTSYYSYDKNHTMLEEIKINHTDVSYYILYLPLEDGRYHKTLQSPVRKDFKWKMDYIEMENWCTITVIEPSLCTNLMHEACKYVHSTYPNVKYITFDISESEDVTNILEIENFEEEFEKMYGVKISRDM